LRNKKFDQKFKEDTEDSIFSENDNNYYDDFSDQKYKVLEENNTQELNREDNDIKKPNNRF
jgi:hypothetical protein